MMRTVSVFCVFISVLFALPSRATLVRWSGNGHCYEARLRPAGIKWASAQTECVTDGGYLATITSQAENDFVFALISGNPSFWFIDSSGNGEGPWLGGFQPGGSPEPGGNWQWDRTGEPFSFANWAVFQPDNAGGAEDRINFWAAGTLIGPQWNDLAEVVEVQSYILEMNTCTVPVDETSWGRIKALYQQSSQESAP